MDTPFDSTLADDIKQLLTEVPVPIRAFFASGKVEIIAKDLMQKNQLHVDQGAVVEREIILLLLGLKNPTEFTQALAAEANLDTQTIDSIVQDINAQIFVPLRAQEMKSGGMRAEQPEKPTAPTPAAAAPAPGVPQGSSHFHLQNKLAPQRPSNAPSARPALRDVLAAVTKIPPPAPVRQMLEDHEEPHIEFHAPAAAPTPQRAAPPANLPGAMPAPAAPALESVQPRIIPAGARPTFVASKVASAAPSVPPVPPARPIAPAKPYSGDPYREPIEP